MFVDRAMRGSFIRPLLLAGLIIAGAGSAAAQWRIDPNVEYFPPRKLLPWVPMSEGMKYVKREPQGRLLLVVSLGEQTVDLYDSRGLVASAPISSGRPDYETPEGVFSVIEKREEHFSNIYDDAHMPFMQRLTWSGIALHQGLLPGRPASSGCIRLPGGFAEWLFRQTRLNTRVVVTPHRPRPIEIMHAQLPESMISAAVADPARRADGGQTQALGNTTLADAGREATGAPASDAPKLDIRDPAAVRAARRAAFQAAEEALARARAASNAHAEAEKAVTKSKADAEAATRAFRTAHTAAQRAEDRLQEAARVADRAKGAAVERAKLAHARAEVALKEARAAVDKAEARAIELKDAVTKAEDAVKAADAAKTAAWTAAREARRAAEPISVLVSRLRGKIYLRQGFEPVGEFAFEVKDPKRSIGTHVFTAKGYAADGERLVWTATTVEDPSYPKRRISPTNGRLGPLTISERIDHRKLAEAALDRVELPTAIIARIVPALHPGATIIISDRGPSEETGKGTDFVLLTNPEPIFWEQSSDWPPLR